MISMKIHFSTKCHGITIGAKGIMSVEKIPFSHVSIELPLGIIFESVPGGSRMIPMKSWIHEYQIIRTFDLNLDVTEAELRRSIDGILSELWSKPYGFGQIFGILILMIGAYSELSRRIAKMFVSSSDLICTELVARFLDSLGLWTGSKSFDTLTLREVFRVAWRLEHGEHEDPSV